MFPHGPSIIDSYRSLLSFQQRSPIPYNQLFNQYGQVLGLKLPGLGKVILSCDKEFNEHILVKNHSNYIKSDHYNEIKPLLGNGLVTSEGGIWKNQRKKITPSFYGFFKKDPFQELQIDIISQHLKSIKDSQSIDVVDFYSNLTFDLVGHFLFGESISEYSSDIQDSLKKFLEVSVNRMFQIFKTPSNLAWGENKDRIYHHKKIDSIIEKLLKNSSPTSLAYVLKNQMNAKELRDELLTLLIAGYETTALALSWSTWLLANHPKEQSEIRQNDLLLQKHWNETLRLYPSIPQISRQTLASDSFKQFSWGKDTLIMILVYHSHRNQDYYTDANQYSLHRHDDFNKSHGAFLPFSLGPRKCLGDTMSTKQGLLILQNVLKKFNLNTSIQCDESDLEMQVSLKPRKTLNIQFNSIES